MSTVARPAFQKAFVALSYLAGRRDAELVAALRTVNEETRSFVQRLAHPERERRAEILARELSRVALSLEARSYK